MPKTKKTSVFEDYTGKYVQMEYSPGVYSYMYVDRQTVDINRQIVFLHGLSYICYQKDETSDGFEFETQSDWSMSIDFKSWKKVKPISCESYIRIVYAISDSYFDRMLHRAQVPELTLIRVMVKILEERKKS